MAIKILEHSLINTTTPPPPPPPATTTQTIPLTFLDIPWLLLPPNQPLFFFHTHNHSSITHSLTTLKHTLSLTLPLFPPFSSHLCLPPPPQKPHFTPNDAVSLTIAESTTDDFNLLTQHQPKHASLFHSLIPPLHLHSTLSIQITFFPGSGFSLGFSYLHVAADLRTFNNFIKTWSFLCCETLNGQLHHVPLPSFDRNVIVDRYGLEDVFLNEWVKRRSTTALQEDDFSGPDRVRASFVIDPAQMGRIKDWILNRCVENKLNRPVHLSSYVLTCSLVWVCLVRTMVRKSKNGTDFGAGPTYFGFNAGGISRMECPVGEFYVGNCVGFGRAEAAREELLGEDGVVTAAHALGNTIKTLDKNLFAEAENWVSDWEVMVGSDAHVLVSGSPKVDLYKTDFGWGRPVKIEEVSIDRKRGISLVESRDFEGGIEVGLVLPKNYMDAFAFEFNQALKPVR